MQLIDLTLPTTPGNYWGNCGHWTRNSEDSTDDQDSLETEQVILDKHNNDVATLTVRLETLSTSASHASVVVVPASLFLEDSPAYELG